MNCTFHDNKAKYGAAIYNQGLLVVTNSTFYSNDGYGKGSDIVNVDKGVVSIDGKNYEACGGDNLVYMKSMSSNLQTVIKVVCYGGAFVLGVVAGFLIANPLVGVAVGAAIGAAVGTLGSAVICSNVYDINFCRWSCALTLIAGSAAAGAVGGGLGGLAGSYTSVTSCAKSYISANAAYTEFAEASTNIVTYTDLNPFAGAVAVGLHAENSYTTLCMAFASYQAALAGVSTSVVVTSTAIVGILAANMVVGAIYVLGVLWTPTIHYTNPNPDDMHSLIPLTSNTYTLSSDLISSIKSNNNIDKVNDLIDKSKNKISFTSDEVLDAISSINLNDAVVKSVLFSNKWGVFMRNIVVVEVHSTGKNYIQDIVDRGFNPVILQRKAFGDNEQSKSYRKGLEIELKELNLDFDLIYEKDTYEETLEIVRSYNPLLVLPASELGGGYCNKVGK